MAAPGWIELFTRPLETLGLPYMVTGSVASTLYGEPRLTLDVDLVVDVGPERVGELLAAFPESEFYRPPLEVARIECAREARGHFNLIHHETGMAGMLAAGVALDRELLEREIARRGLADAWRRAADR